MIAVAAWIASDGVRLKSRDNSTDLKAMRWSTSIFLIHDQRNMPSIAAISLADRARAPGRLLAFGLTVSAMVQVEVWSTIFPACAFRSTSSQTLRRSSSFLFRKQMKHDVSQYTFRAGLAIAEFF